MEKFYIVEDCPAGEFYSFKEIESARKFLLSRYTENLKHWYMNIPNKQNMLQRLETDLNSVLEDYPYVDGFLYTHDCNIMD